MTNSSLTRSSIRRVESHAGRALAASLAFFFLITLLGVSPSSAEAQTRPPPNRVVPVDSIPDVEFPTVFALDPVVVTATRQARSLFTVPQPVSRIDANILRSAGANNVADLFREIQGLDVVGVGPSQVRPSIRGQRGQRILLLSNGVRLQNARRQQDFGEIPALTDVSAVERVEVVRGPSSVLYGSDAIGGVVNVITRRPDEEGTHGNLAYRYGSAGGNNKGVLNMWTRTGAFDFKVGGTYRDASPYDAPSGKFGNIVLLDDATVNDTGVTDWAIDLYAGWTITERNRLYGKFERYDSKDTGFGFVDPRLYAPGQPDIRISYPEQSFNKLTLGYEVEDLNFFLADRVDILAYGQQNDRALVFDFLTTFSLGPSMEGSVGINDQNYTEIETYGTRIEAKKLSFDNLLWTYGIDYFQDRAVGTDVETTTMTGFGPAPIVSTDSTPSLPEATLGSMGLFLQGDYQVGEHGSLIAGARYQRASSKTYATPGLEDQELYDITDDTFVGALNAIWNASPSVAVIGTIGRGFRWPNLVERYFEGSTPEGSGDQIANPTLMPEKSLNYDLGVRYRGRGLSLEVFGFRNNITDAIKIDSVGLSEGPRPRPIYQNVNVAEFLYTGIEASFEAFLSPEFSFGANYTWIDGENKTDVDLPVGEGANKKANVNVNWLDSAGRWWVGYHFRHQAEQQDAFLGTSPVGLALPGFSVHNVRGGFRFFAGQFENRVDIGLNNLGNALYAEAANATFFRPEPGRSVSLTLSTAF